MSTMETTNMLHSNSKHPVHALVKAAALAAGLALLPAAVSAGECPADKVIAGSVTDPGHGPKGVTDKVVASIDLGKTPTGLKDHQLRMRRLVVKPGGIVPWHSHAERPANIYILAGEITEHRSDCAVPIRHKAGDVVAETGEHLSHWWRNDGKRSAVLLSADIFHDKMGDPGMM